MRVISRQTMSVEECFIELVRGHPILYDMEDHNYSNTNMKTRIWNDISEKLKLKSGKYII